MSTVGVGILVAFLLGLTAFLVLSSDPIVFDQIDHSIRLGSAALGLAVAAIGAVKAAAAASSGDGFTIRDSGGASGVLVASGAVMVLASALA